MDPSPPGHRSPRRWRPNASLVSTATAAHAHSGGPERRNAGGGSSNGHAPSAGAGHVGARPGELLRRR
ncbi:hypothetical protein Celaphus_00003998 [Cervus elaphus hippelaphus]|uniref:Uncharacterized protein n=1 Tax=Cervus elaphus hippelaphus TaxID=46360 RepID=A0A212DBT4_CEREH|nr:hypothetical protein Celaphus_00003998 [Cervus elaphus hippelaphus]